MFYARSTCGFYSTEVHHKNIPADAVEITSSEYDGLLKAQSDGKIISTGIDGKPVAEMPPPPTPAQIAQAQSDKAKADIANIHADCIPIMIAYLAGKTDAPPMLKTMAADMQARMLKVK